MKRIIMASDENIDDIVSLRVKMQVEDWNFTLHKDFSVYADRFYDITKNYVKERLNQSLYFAMMYLEDNPVAMCGLEETAELPQITVCTERSGRHGCMVSVYTRPEYRCRGYQQETIKYLLNFAKQECFNDITLTTNAPDAAHIYEKAGFQKISDKYFLGS